MFQGCAGRRCDSWLSNAASQVCIGVLRLILFCLIFTFLMQGTAVGVSSTDRLSFMELLDSSLSLDEFRDIRTLTDFQDYMEQVSSAWGPLPQTSFFQAQNPRANFCLAFCRLKQFSISSSVRFPNPDVFPSPSLA